MIFNFFFIRGLISVHLHPNTLTKTVGFGAVDVSIMPLAITVNSLSYDITNKNDAVEVQKPQRNAYYPFYKCFGLS